MRTNMYIPPPAILRFPSIGGVALRSNDGVVITHSPSILYIFMPEPSEAFKPSEGIRSSGRCETSILVRAGLEPAANDILKNCGTEKPFGGWA